MNSKSASATQQIQMSREKPNQRENESNEEIESKGHANEHQTPIENVRSGFVLRQHERIRRLVMTAGELLMKRPLNAIKPLSNLNVVVTADVEQYVSPPTSPLDQEFHGHPRPTL